MRPQDKIRAIAKANPSVTGALLEIATEVAGVERENGKVRKIVTDLKTYMKNLEAAIAAVERSANADKPYDLARYHALCDVRTDLMVILLAVGKSVRL